jgi:hypothetical protein
MAPSTKGTRGSSKSHQAKKGGKERSASSSKGKSEFSETEA